MKALAMAFLFLLSGIAYAQTPGDVTGNITMQNGQQAPFTGHVALPTPTPNPSPTPPPNLCDFTLTTPADQSTVTAPVTVSIQVQGNPPSARWMNYYAGTYQTSGPLASGSVTLPGPFVQDWTVITAKEMGAGNSCKQSVMVKISTSPVPTPSPGFIPDPQYPDNQNANNTFPSPSWWATFMNNVASIQGQPCPSNGGPCELPASILKQIDTTPFVGTTDQINVHYATEYSIPPDYARAESWTDSQWTQAGIGDCSGLPGCTTDGGTGVSMGIDQIKSGPYPWNYWYTCPTVAKSQSLSDVNAADCMSHLSTSVAVEYWAFKTHQCAIGAMAGYMASQGRDHGVPGQTDYMTEVRNGTAMADCIGQHAGGDWRSPLDLQYEKEVLSVAASKPWLNPKAHRHSKPFMRRLKESQHPRR